ncbi:MAG: WG repeat-containing protein [Bacteroidota bacterium]
MKPHILLTYSCLILGLSLWSCNNGSGGIQGPALLVSWQGNQFGYINEEGETVVPAQFAFAMPFAEGYGAINIGGDASKGYMPEGGKWGFVNQDGKIKINPKYFSPVLSGAPFNLRELGDVSHEGYIFSEGLAAVKDITKYWKYINMQDSVVIDGSKLRILSARRFHDGIANVLIDNSPTGEDLWAYIDKKGNIVIPPSFKFPAEFEDGLAFVVDARNRRKVIDRQGNELYKQYIFVTPFHNGYAAVRPYWRGQKKVDDLTKRRVVLIDRDGAFHTPPDFDWIGRFGEGMAPALVGSKLAHPIIYPQLLTSTEETGGKWGFIDYKGEFKINPTYQEAKGFINGFAPVKRGGLWGYLRPDRSMISGFEFRWAGFFENGLAPVRLGPIHNDYDGLYAYINTSGEIIWIERGRG